METDLDRMSRMMAGAEARPLDDAQRVSNHVNSAFSSASMAAADNLLDKAVRRLEAGADDKARVLVERAVRLPFDEYEEMQPAVWSAHMMLFTSISDDLEDSEPGDQGWLDRAEALIGPGAPVTEAEVRNCLRSFLGDIFQLSPAERTRLKALTRGIPFDQDPLAGVPTDEQSQVSAILELLQTFLRHEASL
jgi:hypothetical protein